jgi:cytoskeletal protein CcmA (bactofilin family)
MTVKGEIRGAQSFYIDGRVEGSIHFPGYRVTIGRGAVVQADVEAKEVVIMGTLTGNINCGDRVDIRNQAVFSGDMVTRRICVDEGAIVKGSVDIHRMQIRNGQEEFPAEPQRHEVSRESARNEVVATEDKPAARPAPAFRVEGSSVLYHEHKAGS